MAFCWAGLDADVIHDCSAINRHAPRIDPMRGKSRVAYSAPHPADHAGAVNSHRPVRLKDARPAIRRAPLLFGQKVPNRL